MTDIHIKLSNPFEHLNFFSLISNLTVINSPPNLTAKLSLNAFWKTHTNDNFWSLNDGLS